MELPKGYYLFYLSGIALLMLAGILSFASKEPETPEVKLVRTYWDEVWSKGNTDGVDAFYHPDAVQGENFSIAGFKKVVEFQRAVAPDFKVTVDEIFQKDNKVVCRVTYTGTHTGRKMWGQEPLGKKFAVPGMDIFTIEGGKCVEHQHVADHLEMVLQVGLKLLPVSPQDTVTRK